MSQVFDFDGPVQTPSPQVFVMETGGGGEGTPPDSGEGSPWLLLRRRRRMRNYRR